MATAGIAFGKYLLTDRIGRGGMAEVWRATINGPAGFARTLVVKRIRPQMAEDPQFVEMFCSEARLSALLTHANIVQVFEFGEVEGEYFLAMEYVRGHDLNSIIQTYAELGLPQPALGAYVARELGRALGYAHTLTDERGRPLGLVHRDVSPSNVLVGFDGTVKLLDFGIAKAFALASSNRTRTGTLKGKMGYLAPEQVAEKKVDHRADLFAVGVVLHETLTGKRLFVRRSTEETLELLREAKVEPPSRHNRNVPPALDQICLKALARDPEQRYASGSAIAAELDEVLHDLRWGPEQMAATMARLFPGEPGAIDERESSTVGQLGAGTGSIGGSATTGPIDPDATIGTIGGGPATGPLDAGPTVHGSEPTVIGTAPRRSARRTGLVALALVGLVAIVAAVAWRQLGRAAPPATPSDPFRTDERAAPHADEQVRGAPSPAAAPAPPGEVAANIRSLPPGAEVQLEGDAAPAGRTPITLHLPRGDARRRVTLSAPGFRPLTLDVEAATDSQVAVALERAAAPAPPRTSPLPHRKRTSSSGQAVLQGEVFDPFPSAPAK
jgi:serine/threonine-protein kinase